MSSFSLNLFSRLQGQIRDEFRNNMSSFDWLALLTELPLHFGIFFVWESVKNAASPRISLIHLNLIFRSLLMRRVYITLMNFCIGNRSFIRFINHSSFSLRRLIIGLEVLIIILLVRKSLLDYFQLITSHFFFDLDLQILL